MEKEQEQKRYLLTLRVPRTDRSAPKKSAPFRRDKIITNTKSHQNSLVELFGFMPTFEKQGQTDVVVTIPIIDLPLINAGHFRDGLFTHTSFYFDIVDERIVTLAGKVEPVKDKRRPENLNGTGSSYALTLLSQFQSIAQTPVLLEERLTQNAQLIKEYREIGKTPDDVLLTIMALEEDIGNERKRGDGLETALTKTRRETVNPNDLTMEDLSVLTARCYAGDKFAEATRIYSEHFTGGLPNTWRSALISDKKTYILDSEDIMPMFVEASIDPNQTIEDILFDVTEATGHVTKSRWHAENIVEYVGAQTLADLHDEEKSEQKLEESFLSRVREIKQGFEEQRDLWELKKESAAELLKVLTDREQEYNFIRDEIEMKKLDLEIPVFAFSYRRDEGRDIYLALPTTRDNENSDLTNALMWDLSQSLRETLGDREDVNLDKTRDIQGSEPLTFYLPNKGEDITLKGILEGVKENYRKRALGNLGIKIRIYNRGEI